MTHSHAHISYWLQTLRRLDALQRAFLMYSYDYLLQLHVDTIAGIR